MNTTSNKTCWTITDEFPGMKSQVIGLAEAIGIETTHKTCQVQWPWNFLKLPWKSLLSRLAPSSDPLTAPWPDIVITCGRRSAPLALEIKRKSHGKTICVHVQDPVSNRDQFDLIAAPEHDKLCGPNVISTKGALHKITQEKLQDGIKAYGSLFEGLPRPYSVVLIGGTTNRYRMTHKAMDHLIQQIFRIQELTQGSVLITPSFRTPYRPHLKQSLQNHPHIFLADIETLNPYFAMLGLANYLFVTDDSVNMICEACFTGKPVYALPLLGHGNTKPKRFINQLVYDGIVRPFEGSISKWTYKPFNDTSKIAAIVQNMLKN